MCTFVNKLVSLIKEMVLFGESSDVYFLLQIQSIIPLNFLQVFDLL